jgi:hypothetical protein
VRIGGTSTSSGARPRSDRRRHRCARSMKKRLKATGRLTWASNGRSSSTVVPFSVPRRTRRDEIERGFGAGGEHPPPFRPDCDVVAARTPAAGCRTPRAPHVAVVGGAARHRVRKARGSSARSAGAASSGRPGGDHRSAREGRAGSGRRR